MAKIRIKREKPDFKQSVFIRKNTPELRYELEKMGYALSESGTINHPCIATAPWQGTYYTIEEWMYDNYNPHTTHNCSNRIDCKTNNKLFLALAALCDNNDYLQWLVLDEPIRIPNGELFWIGSFIQLKEQKFDDSIKAHKATVKELIEHFKN